MSKKTRKHTNKVTPQPNNKGQFKLGNCANPNGRPKNPRRVLGDAFLTDLQEAWKRSGKAVIDTAMKDYPDAFLYASSVIVPPEVRTKIDGQASEDAVFGARVLAACAAMKPRRTAELAACTGLKQLRETLGPDAGDVGVVLDPKWDQLSRYRPYKKQIEFHNAGAEHEERLLMAGNQLGKTLAGAMEWAMHLTGRYPEWWKGKVFNAPVRLWAAGVTQECTRDNPQRVLMGSPQQKEVWGTGTIPRDALKDWTLGYHIADALDSVVVRWGGGGDVQMGESVLSFKSYEKGREKWQGETLDGVWFDEEPPLDIYCEGRTRTIAKRGIVIVTFTPLQGMSEVVKLFLGEADLMKMRAAAGP